MTAPLKRHDYHLGPLGRLTPIRDPAPGYEPAPDIAATVHKLLSGKIHTDRPAFSPRAYSLSFQAMTDAEKAWLEQCALGIVPGPLYWVDPLVRNQLPPQVSAPGSTAAFQALSGTMALVGGSQGFGGVSWVPASGSSALRSLIRQPFLPGSPFTASAWVTRFGGLSTTAQLAIDWYDLAGAQLASTGGSPVTLTTSGAAYRISATTSIPPAGAVEGRLAVLNGAVGTFTVDGMQVEYGPLTAFQPGSGLAKVSILDYRPDVYMSGITDVTVSMVEVSGSAGRIGGFVGIPPGDVPVAPTPTPTPTPTTPPAAGTGLDDGTFAAPGTGTADDGTFGAGAADLDGGTFTSPGTSVADGGTFAAPGTGVADGGTFGAAALSAAVIADVASDADWILTAILADGGIAQYPDKTYMVPYFSNLAALGLARATQVTGDPRYADAAWKWLDWYAAHMDSNGFVTDYNIAPNQAVTSTGDMDSTDSYAGTFLLAAHKTWKVTGNNARLSALSTGLTGAVSAIEATQTADGLTWAKPTYHVKYLMDQAETYAGLQAAYAMAGWLGNAALQTRALTASRAMAAGVATLWNPNTVSYDWAKVENGGRSVTNWSVGYPDAHAQAFAVAFGLVRGARAANLVTTFDSSQPLWDRPAESSNGVLVSYWPPSGWAFIQVGQTARSQLGASRIRSAAITANRAYPYHTGVAGELIVLESTDPSYLAPLVL